MNEPTGSATAAETIGLLHGFAQNAACWGDLADRLAEDRPVIAVDLGGHGAHPKPAGDLWQTAEEACAAIGPGTYIGYSLGGRVALHAALSHPELVQRLVLISATPGIENAEERADRRRSDAELAERIEFVGVDDFVEDWLANPLFAGVPYHARFIDQRRLNTAEGLASSLRLAGTGSQEPLWDRLAEIRVPTLIVAGALDLKFADIAREMSRRIGAHTTLAVMGSAGHSVHLEQPTAFGDLLSAWLDAFAPARPSATTPSV